MESNYETVDKEYQEVKYIIDLAETITNKWLIEKNQVIGQDNKLLIADLKVVESELKKSEINQVSISEIKQENVETKIEQAENETPLPPFNTSRGFIADSINLRVWTCQGYGNCRGELGLSTCYSCGYVRTCRRHSAMMRVGYPVRSYQCPLCRRKLCRNIRFQIHE